VTTISQLEWCGMSRWRRSSHKEQHKTRRRSSKLPRQDCSTQFLTLESIHHGMLSLQVNHRGWTVLTVPSCILVAEIVAACREKFEVRTPRSRDLTLIDGKEAVDDEITWRRWDVACYCSSNNTTPHSRSATAHFTQNIITQMSLITEL